MANVIIGIHGLSNKPPKDTLALWWKAALLEGLQKNTGRTRRKPENDPLNFESIYWADVTYPGGPVDNADNDEPYERAGGNKPFPFYQEGWRDELRRRFQEVGDGILDFAKDMFGLSAIADAVLASKLEDLSRYYQEDAIRRELRGRLISSLEWHLDNGDRIMVIAHSMGSIIAYDVLRELGRQRPSARVDHFITIGSPLGLPHVMFHHMAEFDAVRTPTVVKRWTNFADRRDIVSLDTHLSDDYGPNVEGVRVVDDLVFNGYTSTGTKKENPHKSYGYLRTPELSQAVRQFI